MRCPACGSDTTPALPRCTRCNAPVNSDAAPEQAPVPPPWAPSSWPPPSGEPVDPSTWPAPPPPHEGRGEEAVTPLSPEPWAQEPEIWRPPPPPKRSAVPYVLAGAGVVVLMAVALAIIFWPSSSGTQTPPENSPAQQQSESTSSEPTSSANAQADGGSKLNQQAGQVDTLLAEMANTRSDLGVAVTNGCNRDALEQIRDQRRDQLARAQQLQVDGLENGTKMRDALVRALLASIESNQRYLAVAPGCPSEGEVSDVNTRANDAKTEFVGYWRPNAEKAGLDVRSPGQL